jgi:outer membrane receptor for Fe3+-dicitrate
MSKGIIFVRERRKVQEGEKKPRFAVVGVAGMDLKLHAKHIRRMELEQMAKLLDAEIVYLDAGKDEEDIDED